MLPIRLVLVVTKRTEECAHLSRRYDDLAKAKRVLVEKRVLVRMPGKVEKAVIRLLTDLIKSGTAFKSDHMNNR
jgi:hypothetical protein